MAIEVEWARMTGPELRLLAAREGATAILPVGALEQHGPHLPCITDTASANEAALRAARLVADSMPVVVFPGFWLGLSEHHLPFGGSVSLNFSAYHAVISNIARSLKALGFSRLLIVNGHGGNVDALAVIVREVAHEWSMPIVCTTPWYLAEAEHRAIFESDFEGRHACEGETSIMMAITPNLIRRDAFEEAMRQRSTPVKRRPGFVRFFSFAELAPVTGITGDPRKATAEKGERFLNIQARELAAALSDESLWTQPDPVWSPGRGLGEAACRQE